MKDSKIVAGRECINLWVLVIIVIYAVYSFSIIWEEPAVKSNIICYDGNNTNNLAYIMAKLIFCYFLSIESNLFSFCLSYSSVIPIQVYFLWFVELWYPFFHVWFRAEYELLTHASIITNWGELTTCRTWVM